MGKINSNNEKLTKKKYDLLVNMMMMPNRTKDSPWLIFYHLKIKEKFKTVENNFFCVITIFTFIDARYSEKFSCKILIFMLNLKKWTFFSAAAATATFVASTTTATSFICISFSTFVIALSTFLHNEKQIECHNSFHVSNYSNCSVLEWHTFVSFSRRRYQNIFLSRRILRLEMRGPNDGFLEYFIYFMFKFTKWP